MVKILIKFLIIFIFLFVSSPVAFFHLLTNADFFGWIPVDVNQKLGYFLKTYLPGLMIILINNLLIFTIFLLTSFETNPRYSLYHRRIMHREFSYLLINMLLIPGLAIPTGYSVYKTISMNLANLETFLQNFYIVQSSNFFITLMIQQTSLGFLSMMLQLPQLPSYAFSPSYFLAFRKKTEDKRAYFTSIGTTFDYGYHSSVILAVMGIVFVYSFHFPIISTLGAFYLAFKMLADAIWIRNVYRQEFNGNGAIVHRACRRTVHLLMVLQVCTGLKFMGEGNVEAVICILGLVIITIAINGDFKDQFIKPEILDSQRLRPSLKTMQEWEQYFSHPIEKEAGLKELILPVLEYMRRSVN